MRYYIRNAARRVSLMYAFRPGKHTFLGSLWVYYAWYNDLMNLSLLCALTKPPDDILVPHPELRCYNANVLRLLIAAGANVNYYDGYALSIAIDYDDYDAAEVLVSAGIKLDSDDLERAITNKCESIARLMVTAGAIITLPVIDAAAMAGDEYTSLVMEFLCK